MPANFKINKSAVEKLTRNLQCEFDKNPVSIPIQGYLEVSGQDKSQKPDSAPTIVNNYHAPVVTNYGNRTQIAWGSQNITQTSEHQENVATGFEEFAQGLEQVLTDIDTSPIAEEEKQKFKTIAEQTLQETAQPNPDVSILSVGIERLKGILAAAALGLHQGVTAEAQDIARSGLEALNQLPGLLP
ncbi:hypothetical protein [Rothia sp. 32237D007AR]